MKYPYCQTGGRPFTNDDIVTLQQELTDAVQAQFLGKGPFILSGCVVSGLASAATVTAGIVCLDGQLLRFAGQSGVALPAQFQAGAAVLSDPRPYQTGGTKNCMREVPAVLVASNPAYTTGEFLPLDVWGSKRWDDVVRASVRYLGEIQQLGAAGYTAADYDTTTGVGKPGTSAWGWQLSDTLGGRSLVGLDITRADYDTVGKIGGEEKHTLTIPELPRFVPTVPRVANVGNTPGDGSVLLKGGDPGGSNSGLTSWPLTPIGGGAEHENRSPFTVVLMRQWIGYGF